MAVDGITQLMLFKPPEHLFPTSLPHEASGEGNTFRVTVIMIWVSMLCGTFMGYSRLAKLLRRSVMANAAVLSL